MATLICFGFGYCAEHFVAMFGDEIRSHRRHRARRRARRDPERAIMPGACKALVFDGTQATPELNSAIAEADEVLVSVPPDENGDPVLRVFGAALVARERTCASIVYLSTIGVYGDRGGEWVDEDNAGRAGFGAQPRAARRRTGLARARRSAAASRVAMLRLAGIYGPGQNALVQIARGKRPPHRQARPDLQPHPCRRHRASDRCRVRAPGVRDFQRRRRRADAARRSDRLSPRNFWASRRRRKSRLRMPRRRCRRWR